MIAKKGFRGVQKGFRKVQGVRKGSMGSRGSRVRRGT
jgi:hypothetical protein